jgi:hypothetical protein
MTLKLNYPDVATFVKVQSGGYSGSKEVVSQDEVNVIFEQDTNFDHISNQDGVTSDATCWPDITNEFIVDNFNRLEGMYIMIPLFGSGNEASWFKIESCMIFRDHLLGNTIDNIELRLKKTRPIPTVS